MKITSQRLLWALVSVGIPHNRIILLDHDFQTVETKEVQSLYEAWLRHLPKELVIERRGLDGQFRRVPIYLDDCWDCDNHSTDFSAFACRSNAWTRVKTGDKRGGLALGRISYNSVGNGRVGAHATNVYVDKSLAVHFWEPADGKKIVLTEPEIKGSWDVICM